MSSILIEGFIGQFEVVNVKFLVAISIVACLLLSLKVSIFLGCRDCVFLGTHIVMILEFTRVSLNAMHMRARKTSTKY